MLLSNEKKLWLRVKRGDEKAFAKLYDIYVDKIYRFVVLKINQTQKAEEIVQDIFLKLWKLSQRQDKEIGNLSAVLYQIARFTVIDYYRLNNKKTVEIEINEEKLIDEGRSIEVLDRKIDVEYDLQKIKQALNRLPEIYKDIIIMKFIDELDNSEIAQVLGKSEGNIRVLAHRALKKLRQLLGEKIDK